jgi:ketosteroid isomerase-like protein
MRGHQECLAREVLDAAHFAWSAGDIEGVLRQCSDDLVYWCNICGRGRPIEFFGQEAFRAFLAAVAHRVEGMSVTDQFNLDGCVGGARIEYYMRDRRTGLLISGAYRQVVTFRAGRIHRIEERYDAAMMTAFWRLIIGEKILPAERLQSSLSES